MCKLFCYYCFAWRIFFIKQKKNIKIKLKTFISPTYSSVKITNLINLQMIIFLSVYLIFCQWKVGCPCFVHVTSFSSASTYFKFVFYLLSKLNYHLNKNQIRQRPTNIYHQNQQGRQIPPNCLRQFSRS